MWHICEEHSLGRKTFRMWLIKVVRLTNANKVKSFVYEQAKYDSEENPRNDSVCPEMRVVVDVTEAQLVELFRIAASSDIDGDDDRPCQADSDEADECYELEESEE